MKTRADPTGQARNRKRAKRPVNKRLLETQKRVLALIDNIRTDRRVVINADQIVYDWFISPEQMADLRAQIELEIQAGLEVIPARPPHNWYGDEAVTRPAEAAALDSVNQVNKTIAALALTGYLVRGLRPQKLEPFSVLVSPAFRDKVKTDILTYYTSIKSVGSRLASKVSNNVIGGINARQSPRDLKRAVRSSFEVARSDAARSVDTTVNQSYNDAVTVTTELAAEATDTQPRIIHISALTSTTRAHHAARHRLAYTVEAQEAWWDEGDNRINCKCGTIPHLEANS